MSDLMKTPQEITGTDGKITIPNVYLEPFERAVYARQHEVAGKMLVGILNQMRMGAEVVGYTTDAQTKIVLYTRLAACITALVSDPVFQLSQTGFDTLAAEHATIDGIFRASAFHTSDHLARQFSDWDPAKPTRIKFRDSPNLAKFLLTFSLDSQMRLDFEKLFAIDPRVTLPLYVGMLAHLDVLTESAHVRREYLLKVHEAFLKVRPTDTLLLGLSDAYMYTSYAHLPEKHQVKRTINTLYKRFLNHAYSGNVDAPTVRPPRDRPMILVGLEWYTSLHAMYRCFHPVIQQLRQHYYVVGMGRALETDEPARQSFDRWITIPDRVILVDLIQQIRTLAPDLIFYPSLGMSYWMTMMATCRLAPIQFMGVGHPASSLSPEIDYIIVEEGIIADPALASETLIEIPRGSTRFIMRADAGEHPPAEIHDTKELRVAIPAMAAKLTRPFIDVLAQIEAAVPDRELTFVFFPNIMGVVQFNLEKDLRRRLRRVQVHGRLDYDGYRRYLHECDLHLSPFPFGGTNSNIDSMLLGIPMIALEGKEPHATVDAQMMRRIGMGEWVVQTEADYVAKAALLLTKNDVRRTVALAMRAAPIAEAFFGEGPPEVHGAWLRAVQEIEKRHEEFRYKKVVRMIGDLTVTFGKGRR